MANLKLRRLASSNKVKFIETPSGVFNLQVDSSSTKFKSYDSSVSATLNGIFPASTFIEENSLGNPAVNSNHELNYIDTRGPEAPVTHVAQYNDFSVELTSPTLNYKTFKNDRTIEYEKDNVAVAIYPAPSADVFGNPIYDENYLNSLSGEPFRFEQLEYAYAGELPLNIVNYNYDDGKRYSDVFALKNHYDHHWNTSGSITVDSNSDFLSAELRHTRDYKRLGINKSDAWLSYRPQYQYNEDETRLPGSYLYVASGTYTPNTSARIGEVLNANSNFVFSSSPGEASEVSATNQYLLFQTISAETDVFRADSANSLDLQYNYLACANTVNDTVDIWKKTYNLWELKQTLTPYNPNGTTNMFGESISLDIPNNRMVVASMLDTSDGYSCLGALYFYTFSNGIWTQTQRVIPQYDYTYSNPGFGSSLVLNGDYCIVGVDDADYSGYTRNGIIIEFLYNNTTNSWEQNQILCGSITKTGSDYGYSIDNYNNDLLVGSRKANTSGLVFYYQKTDDGIWTETQILSSTLNETGAEFGWDVKIHGDTCAISAPYDRLTGVWNGRVSIFKKSNGTWSETQTITGDINIPVWYSYFGRNLDLYENTLIINAVIGTTTELGLAYVYNRDNEDTNFTLTNVLSSLEFGGRAESESFPTKVFKDQIIRRHTSLSGIIQLETYDLQYDITSSGTSGNCFVFTVSGDNEAGEIIQYQELSSSYIQDGDLYGYSLASNENWVFVGAPAFKTSNNSKVGAVIAFKWDESTLRYEEDSILTANSYYDNGDEFGKSLAVQGNYLFVGATEDEALGEINPTGIVHIFYLQNDVWNWLQKIVGENIDDDFGSQLEAGKTNEMFIGAINGDIGNTDIKLDFIDFGENVAGGLTTSNQIYMWGFDTYGELGINRQGDKSLPEVFPNHSFVKIVNGEKHCLGLKEDGTVWSWGKSDCNIYGQLGINTADVNPYYTPISVIYNHSFIDITAGYYSSYGLKSNGEVWAWGLNNNGQLGDNTTSSKLLPVSVSGTGNVVKFVSIDAMQLGSTIYALDDDNNIWGWGNETLNDFDGSDRSFPYQLNTDYKFDKFSVGNDFVMALSANSGQAYSWGKNGWVLGTGDTDISSRTTPTAVYGNPSFIKIESGFQHVLALSADGSLWTWGYNADGQLGINSSVDVVSSPVNISTGYYRFEDIFAGNNTSYAIGEGSYNTWVWGSNDNYSLGLDINRNISSPTIMPYISQVTNVTFTEFNTLACTNNSTYSWGLEYSLGGWPNNKIQYTPQKLYTDIDFIDLSLGQYHGIGLDINGDIWGWGRNNYKQISSNKYLTSINTPVKVNTTNSFIKISAGNNCSFGLKENGEVWSWGRNNSGQLGLGYANSYISNPTKVIGDLSFVNIINGTTNTFALSANGEAWAWGSNFAGSLGAGVNDSYITSAIPLSGGHSFIKISSSGAHTLGLKENGEAWAWGYNNYGQLGNNESGVISYNSPISVSGNHSFIDISTGLDSSFALNYDGSVWAWGRNISYRFGDGEWPTSYSSPISINNGLNNKFNKIFNGGYFSTAIDNPANKIYVWGSNENGQLALPENISYASYPELLSHNIPSHNNGTVYRYEKGGGLDWEWKQTLSGQYSQDGKFGTSIKYDSQSDGLYILDKYQYNENLKTFQNSEILSAEVSGILYAFERDNNDNFVEYDAIGFNSLSGTYTPIEILPNNTDLLISTEFVSGTTDYNTILLIFNKENGEWVPRSDVYNIQPEIIDIDEQFGKSLIKQNDYILIGHPGDDSDKGLIWVYERNNKIYIEKEEETTEISKYEFIERIQGVNRISSDASHKSNIFSIELKDSGLNESIDDVETRQKIQSSIKNAIKELLPKVTPAQTQLWKINFKGD